MEQFSLEKWLKDKSCKVVTRDGKTVRIVCFDAPDNVSIYGFVEGEIQIRSWKFNGNYDYDGRITDLDLFLVSEEEEKLTEFEEAVKDCAFGKITCKLEGESEDEYSKRWAGTLLELARNEIFGNTIKEIERRAYDEGKASVLQDLPKWRRDCFHNITSAVDGRLYYNGYYIDINELLEKLPKE